MSARKEGFWSGLLVFFEAEGSVTAWNDRGRLRFRVDVLQQDEDLMYFIQKSFGFGKVVLVKRKDAKPYWRYAVEDLPGLLQMIDLLNGNLVLQKRQTAFEKWLLSFNETKNTQILYKKGTPQITLTDGWLSGFLEGDGGFFIPKKFIRTNNKGEVYDLKQRFFVTQKNGDELIKQLRSLFNDTKAIRDQFNTVINPKTKLKETRRYARMEIATLPAAKILLGYLSKFPFFGKRQITIDAWKELLKYRETKYPVTPETTATLQKLIDQTKKVESQLQAKSAGTEPEDL